MALSSFLFGDFDSGGVKVVLKKAIKYLEYWLHFLSKCGIIEKIARDTGAT